jgi:hypothetical protein
MELTALIPKSTVFRIFSLLGKPFAAFVDSLPETTAKKFAHRYARPEAKSDYKHEFSYKCNWNILC